MNKFELDRQRGSTLFQIVDRQTIARHLLSDQNDPFNRDPLTLDKVIPQDELKEVCDVSFLLDSLALKRTFTNDIRGEGLGEIGRKADDSTATAIQSVARFSSRCYGKFPWLDGRNCG